MEYVNEHLELVFSVQKALRNFKKDAASRKTEAYFETRLEMISSLRVEFRENHRQIMHLSGVKEVEENYVKVNLSEQFEEAYLDAVSTIRAAFAIAFPTSPSENHNLSNVMPVANAVPMPSNEVPLPEVKLPTFSESYVEWPAFKEMFLARVHTSDRLNNCQRLHYLKGALSSAAAQDIQHISILGENYQSAWKMLSDLYDNDRILFFHFMEVFEEQPAINPEDASALRQFTQTCRSCVNSIQKLGVNLQEQNQILVYYMLKKLPAFIHREWDRTTRKQKTVPTFDELCSVLDEQYQMMILSSNLKPNRPALHTGNKLNSKASSSKRDITSLHVTRFLH